MRGEGLGGEGATQCRIMESDYGIRSNVVMVQEVRIWCSKE